VYLCKTGETYNLPRYVPQVEVGEIFFEEVKALAVAEYAAFLGKPVWG
jgi:hypothetical protein